VVAAVGGSGHDRAAGGGDGIIACRARRRWASRRRRSSRAFAWQGHIVHIHSGVIAEAILVHQELDAHRLPRIGRHVHCLVDPRLRVVTLMEDGLQDGAGAIRDVSILPVERDGVDRKVPVPEAQCASTSGDHELLIE
jgi:hypothetical protein